MPVDSQGPFKQLHRTLFKLFFRFSLIMGVLLMLGWTQSNVNWAQRVAVPTSHAPMITTQLVTTGVTSPVAITNAGDGSGRLFIVEQAGTIRIFQNGSILSPAFLNITSKVESGGEKGLLGLAFHPNYASNRRFFVNYTTRVNNPTPPPSTQLITRVAEYAAMVGNANQADPNSERVILEFNQPFDNHNGGDLHFGPDGYLYISAGDGGSGGDPQGNGQNQNTLLGKILRIDINNGPPFTTPYAIPPTNPFFGQPGKRGEIWAYGLRNPWRISFDRLTGDLFIADVGQSSWEEVDFQPANSTGGVNYGWNIMEGNHCYPPATPSCNMTGLTLPILEYSHGAGDCSITGGFRYRGGQIAQLYSTYIYGDYCTGRIWGATFNGTSWTSTLLVDTPYNISTFGEDQSGEIYFANLGGAIYKIVQPATSALFKIDRETGFVYADGAYFCGLGTPGPAVPPAAPCFNAGLGADVAERVDSLELLEPGDVIEIDPEHSGYFRKSRGTPLVVGVVSTRAGMTMANRAEQTDSRPSIALIGRVPVKATTKNGSIQLGDLLTPASKPGYAIRCNSPCVTPILGKALGALSAREGWVMMLVMRP